MNQATSTRRGFNANVGLIYLGLSTYTFAGDQPVSSGVPTIRLTLASRISEKMTFATVTFDADGLDQLPQGGWVSVNDVVLHGVPLKRHGFWYRANIPKNSAYKGRSDQFDSRRDISVRSPLSNHLNSQLPDLCAISALTAGSVAPSRPFFRAAGALIPESPSNCDAPSIGWTVQIMC